MDSTHICTASTQRGACARGEAAGAAEGPAWIRPNFLESLSSEKLLEPAPEAPLLSCSMETPCQSMDGWRINGLIFCQQHTHCCQISPRLCSKISSPVCPCAGTGGTRRRCPGPHAGPKIRNSGGQEGPWPGFHPPWDPHGHRMDKWMRGGGCPLRTGSLLTQVQQLPGLLLSLPHPLHHEPESREMTEGAGPDNPKESLEDPGAFPAQPGKQPDGAGPVAAP